MSYTSLKPIIVFLIAYLSAIFVLPRLALIAKKIDLTDRPNARKVYTTPRPLMGGIGIMISVTFASLLFVPLGSLRGFGAGLSLLLFIGFLDDFKEIGHYQKFLAQMLASALLIYFSDNMLVSFGDLLGIGKLMLPITWVAWIVTVFCVVGVINAINLIDGLDGLAGGISFVAFMMFAAHALHAGNDIFLLLNLIFAGAVLGFLRFNWPPSSLFMGDAGSLCLGFALSFMAIAMTQGADPITSPVTALLILVVPIVDTLTIMSKRVINGGSPFRADRYHLHHILMRNGLSKKGTIKIIIALSFIAGSISLLGSLYSLPEYILFSFFFCYFIVYFAASFFILKLLKYRLKFRRKREWCGLPCIVIRFCFNLVDRMGFFRKADRYDVCISFDCHDRRNDQHFGGTMVNLSRNGCMACIPEMAILGSRVDLEIKVPHENESDLILNMSADHLWVSKFNNKRMHGFKFHQISKNQQVAFNALLHIAT